jgi:pimeloyl-ACP methyl ester carboxylesterase
MPVIERQLSLKGPNGTLAAAFHDCGSDRLVIFAHGFTGTKVEAGRLFVEAARATAAAGINVVRFDFFGSGDSAGAFQDMTPNTELADLLYMIKWGARRSKRLGVLGLSFGGAISICACAQSPAVKTLVTWSSLPRFKGWRDNPNDPANRDNPLRPGKRFYVDRPKVDVPEAFCSLTIPRLQVQGDRDLPGFLEGYREYFDKARGTRKHVIIPEADHVFSQATHRRKAIATTVKWFQKYL